MSTKDLGLSGEAGTAGHSDFRDVELDKQDLAKEAVPDKGPERPMPPADPEER